MQREDPTNWKFASLLKLIILVQFLMNISILLDIAYVRQILGFIYLTFIPGILLLKALKISNLNPAKSILFSVGLSIALLMFAGLFVNELYPLIGISEPLSDASLMITVNLLTLLLCSISYFRNKNGISLTSFSFSPLILFFLCLPLLSVFGTFLVNSSEDNTVLLLMIAMIPVLVALTAISKKLFPSNFYSLALFCIAIALLFHTSLITNYIVGWDVHTEYYVFNFTKNNSRWDAMFNIAGRYRTEFLSANSMLSVTILPGIYSEILKTESFVFKIFYPFVFSLVPVGLYQLWHSQIREKNLSSLGVFLSTFFIVSVGRYATMGGLLPAKQMASELFYVLLFLVIFDEKIEPGKRKLLFIIFSAALVVSHYSISYLFLFLIFFTWLSSLFLRFRSSTSFSTFLNIKRRITPSLFVLFFVMAFSWYIYTSSSGEFTNFFRNYVDKLIRNFFEDFFSPEARGSKVLTGIGLTAAPSFLHQIGRFFFYITEFFIIIGFVRFIVKRKEMKLDEDYAILTGLNMAILLMAMIIPNFAAMFLMDRFYHVVLLFLAPMCIFGGQTFFMFLLRRKKEFSALFLVLVLIPLFLFETEFVYTISRDYSDMDSLALNMNVMNPVRLYGRITLEQEVLGAKWLSTHIDMTNSLVAGDSVSPYHVLTSYGMIPGDRLRTLSNSTMEGYINLRLEGVDNRTYIYLRRLNIVNGIIGQWNITEISSVLNYENKIYSNGNCEIYNGLANS